MLKVNDKKLRSMAGLLSITILTTTGCSLDNCKVYEIPKSNYHKENFLEDFNVDKETIETEDDTYHLYYTEELPLEVKENPTQDFLDQLLITDFGYNSNIQDFYRKYSHILENWSLEDNQNIRMYYAKLSYEKIIKFGIPYTTMIEELNNIMIEQQHPRCLSEEDRNRNFSSLISTLSDNESLLPTYFPLAYFVHQTKCQDEHEIGFCVSCKRLKKEFNSKYNR